MSAELIVACVVLVAGTYAVRAVGMFAPRERVSGRSDEILENAVVVLLAAVAVTMALYDGHEVADPSRGVGVLAGAAAAACRLSLPVILLIAGGTAAVLRLVL